MAWKKDDKKSPKAQPQAKALPASRRGRPPAGTVAAKARFDKPKKGGYHTRESTGGAKAKAIRQAALQDVRDNTVVDVEGVMAHVRATMPIAEYLKETSSEYNPYVGRALCFVIATSDLGLEDAMALVKPELEADGVKVPHHMVVYKWRKEDKDFDTLYRDARLMQSHYLVDCAMRYAKGPLNSEVRKVKSGGALLSDEVTVTYTDNVSRSRLIVETIMRRAAQLNPDYREKREEDSDKPSEQLEALVAALKGGDDEDGD
jgi:hypothetical protein